MMSQLHKEFQECI